MKTELALAAIGAIIMLKRKKTVEIVPPQLSPPPIDPHTLTPLENVVPVQTLPPPVDPACMRPGLFRPSNCPPPVQQGPAGSGVPIMVGSEKNAVPLSSLECLVPKELLRTFGPM